MIICGTSVVSEIFYLKFEVISLSITSFDVLDNRNDKNIYALNGSSINGNCKIEVVIA